MSDQARPAEIEDVLSSIRRLVAGNAETTAAVARAPIEPSPEQAAPDDAALVLTPSLLVNEAEADNADPHRAWDADAVADERTEGSFSQDDEGAAGTPEPAPGLDAESLSGEQAQPGEQSPDEPDFATPESEAAFAQAGADPDPVEKLSGTPPETRKSPFLSETLIAQRTPKTDDATDSAAEGRTGFGFAGARRDDPVRHVPLSELNAGAGQAEEQAEQSGRTLHLSVATDETAETSTSTAEAPPKPSSPFFAPGFAVEPAASSQAAPALTENDDADLLLADDEAGETSPPSDTHPDPSEAEITDASADQQEDTEAVGGDVDESGDEPVSATQDVVEDAVEEPTRALEINDEDPVVDDPAPTDEKVAGLSRDDEAPSTDLVDFLPDMDTDEIAKSDEGVEPSATESREATPESADETTLQQDAGQAECTSEDVRGDSEPLTDLPYKDPDKINVFGPSGGALDEEAIRALVADVLHDELQGELGERVSDNIRLLVRREVKRALEQLPRQP